MIKRNHNCFDHERWSHKDGMWDIWVCAICSSEYTYIARNPYDKQGKLLSEKTKNLATCAAGAESTSIGLDKEI